LRSLSLQHNDELSSFRPESLDLLETELVCEMPCAFVECRDGCADRPSREPPFGLGDRGPEEFGAASFTGEVWTSAYSDIDGVVLVVPSRDTCLVTEAAVGDDLASLLHGEVAVGRIQEVFEGIG